MGATEKKPAVADLIEQGRIKGKLTTKEITDALEELDFDPEQMEKLYDSLERILSRISTWTSRSTTMWPSIWKPPFPPKGSVLTTR